MDRRVLPRWIVKEAAVIVGGLGLGIGAACNGRVDSSLPTRDTTAAEVSHLAEGPIVTARAAAPEPAPARKGEPQAVVPCWSA